MKQNPKGRWREGRKKKPPIIWPFPFLAYCGCASIQKFVRSITILQEPWNSSNHQRTFAEAWVCHLQGSCWKKFRLVDLTYIYSSLQARVQVQKFRISGLNIKSKSKVPRNIVLLTKWPIEDNLIWPKNIGLWRQKCWLNIY